MAVRPKRCRLSDILNEVGWIQQDLVDKSGLSKQTISFYATNRRKRMPLDVAVTIADTINARTGRQYSPRDLYEWVTER